jgi:hypothetical protein
VQSINPRGKKATEMKFPRVVLDDESLAKLPHILRAVFACARSDG